MRLKLVTLLFGLLLAALTSRADLSFAITSPTPIVTNSSEIFFSGVLTNTDLTDLFLNNLQINFANAATNFLNADTNIFFANVPGILLSNETYTDLIFAVTFHSNIPPGNYFGQSEIQGGTNIFATNVLAIQAFQIFLPPASLNLVWSNNDIVISWLPFPTGFVLQRNSDLTLDDWIPVTTAVTTNDDRIQIVLPFAKDAEFFRLAYTNTFFN